MTPLQRRTTSPLRVGAFALALTGCPADDDSAITSATEGPVTTSPTTSPATTSITSTASSPDPPTTETSVATTSTTGPTTTATSDTTTDGTTSATSQDSNSDTAGDTCGDGDIDPGEECDLGSDNDNHGECTKLCHLATCGDGLQQPGEECDDGADNHPTKYNGCTPQCHLGPHCGDGHVDIAHEACDPEDPNLADPAVCLACQWGAKLVFVTSTVYLGNPDGISGADGECQLLAAAAGLTQDDQVFRAWLSDTHKSAADRLAHADIPYILVNGAKIANKWSDLLDGGLLHAINLDQKGLMVSGTPYVWTGTTWDGATKVDATCADWTSSDIAAIGSLGWSAKYSSEWTEAINFGKGTCSKASHLYCVQQ